MQVSPFISARLVFENLALAWTLQLLCLLLVPYLSQKPRDSSGQITYSIVATAWLIPLLCMPLAAVGLPITPLLLVGLLGAIWKTHSTELKKRESGVARGQGHGAPGHSSRSPSSVIYPE